RIFVLTFNIATEANFPILMVFVAKQSLSNALENRARRRISASRCTDRATMLKESQGQALRPGSSLPIWIVNSAYLWTHFDEHLARLEHDGQSRTVAVRLGKGVAARSVVAWPGDDQRSQKAELRNFLV